MARTTCGQSPAPVSCGSKHSGYNARLSRLSYTGGTLMTTLTAVPEAAVLAPALHPLDPLTPQEMERAVEILRQSGPTLPASGITAPPAFTRSAPLRGADASARGGPIGDRGPVSRLGPRARFVKVELQ